MLPTRSRLGSSSQIRLVYSTGKRTRMASVRAYGLAREAGEGQPARVAIIASKTVGSAVLRNRSKRRLRSAAALLIPSLRPNALVVLAATPAALSVSFQILETEVRAACGKIGVLA